MSGRGAQLTTGPVGGHLVRMAVPMLIGIFATMTFNLADIWFVGQLGSTELAAISFTFPVIMVLVSVAIGLGAGTSSIVARAIGEGPWPRVQRLTTDAMLLTGVVSVVMTVIGVLTIDPLFKLLGADERTLPLIREYMTIWYLGSFSVLLTMVGMSAIRATGDTRVPSQLMIWGAIINLILDPILIFGFGPIPGYGIGGAAWASVLARGVTVVVAIYYLGKHIDMLSAERRSFAKRMASFREILHVGLPAAGTNAIIPLAIGVATALIAKYGQNAVAGFGVASRVESLALISFYALSAVIGPFAGQNLGAGHTDRILVSLKLCNKYSVAAGAIMALILAIAAEPIARFFNDDPEIIAVAVVYLQIVPISYFAAAMVMIMNATFNGIGNPLPAVVVSAFRMLALFLPLAWVASSIWGVNGIFIALALANVLCGIGAYIWVRARILQMAAAS